MLEADYFEQKRRELGFHREDQLAKAQGLLDGWYPGRTRVKSLNRGVLRVLTTSAAVASELRMRQVELMQAAGLEEARLAIVIGGLD